jgi:polyhydroxybutyrate depolymerase
MRLGFIAYCFLFALYFSQPAIADDDEQRLVVENRKRYYRVHVPQGYSRHTPTLYPAVIVLHGAAANSKLIEKVTGMSQLADKQGFIAVYPNGTAKLSRGFASWNGGVCCWFAAKAKINDVAFLDQLITKITHDYAIDPSRVYIAGFSNGGMLAYRAAAPLQNKVAALGIVQGSMSGDEIPPTCPMPVVIFHGTDDKRVPYAGGKGKYEKLQPVNDKPVAYAVDFWRKVNGVETPPLSVQKDDVICQTHLNKEGKPVVILYSIIGGGHAWAGGEKSRPWGAKPAESLDASVEMWRFFQMQNRAGALAAGALR